MTFIASAGVTNVDLLYVGMGRIPEEGEEIYAKEFRICLGGGAPGTAVTAARLGIPVRLATFLGNDLFSGFAHEELKRSHVELSNLLPQGETQIPVNVTSVMITERDRTFASYGYDKKPDREQMETLYQMSKGAKLAQMQLGFLPVYRRLKEEGTKLLLDFGWDEELSLEKYRDYIELADYYTPNQKEAMKITGTASPQDAIEVLARYIANPLVELDKDGALLLSGGSLIHVEAIPEFTYRDATGAGDAFLAGLMYGLFHDYGFQDAVLFGNITGGKCITEAGALTAWVGEEELLAIADRYRVG